jgi:hypothetical protein
MIRRLASIVAALLALTLQAACGIPGIRPEGQTQTVTGTAPAGVDAVFERAKRWYGVNRYVLSDDVRNQLLRGYKTLRIDGSVETRAVVRFTIKRSGAAETRYEIESYTEVGVPPVMRRADSNVTEAVRDVSTLDSWLACGSARWPGCP